MRIESVWFGGGIYERMARVFLATAQDHCPGWEVNVYKVDRKKLKRHPAANQSHVSNTQKMVEWNAIVQAAEDGDRILLADSDTFFTGPADGIWSRDFDIAYTDKEAKFPFNSGVVFVRVSPLVRAFFAKWNEVNSEMLASARPHLPWRRRFGGINQAAFGKMLESDHAKTVNIVGVPCLEWNCEDSAWASFDPERTRIVHVKSALRRAIMSGKPCDKPGVNRLADLWRGIEASL